MSNPLPRNLLKLHAEKLTENKLRSYNKRPVRCEGPVFGYIVCDIDSSFEKYLRTNRGFKKVDNGFFYSVMDCGGFALVLEVLSLDYVLSGHAEGIRLCLR